MRTRARAAPPARTRPGFARLLAAVAGAEAGIVIPLEVTRLARNSSDWHHSIDLCRFTGTLIADEQTVYDPALSSDRIVLGIHGQMGGLELENSIARMVEARRHKAARGALLTIPPPGYEVDEGGELVMTSARLPRCGAEMRIVPFITETAPIERVLTHIGEPVEPPRINPARGPPAWDDPPIEAEPDWDALAQPPLEYIFDQRVQR